MAVGSRSQAAEDVRERVRAASDIVEVVGQFVSLRKAGRSWKGLCPFHQEKTPSFVVTPERQTYHCFGCGVGGDVFGFIEEMEKVSFPEALRILGERAGIEIPSYRPQGDSVEVLYRICEEAAEFYRRCLLDDRTGRAARDLLRARGIGKETEEKFGLGYAPGGWDALSSRLGPRHGEENLVRAGLAVARDGGRGVYDRFRERLVSPLRSASGRVLGFGGRAVGGGEPKYLNPPETPVYRKGEFLFGLGESREHLRHSGQAILVEGYFDALILHQAGFGETLAVGGTAVTADQARLLSRYVDRVRVTLDGDEAGRVASRRSLGPLINAGLEVRVVMIPEGEDPDSLVRQHGAAALAELMESAPGAVAFLCREADRDAAAHGRAVAAVLDLARELTGLAAREGILIEADRHLGVGLERLRIALGEAGDGRQTAGRNAPQSVPAGVATFEESGVPYMERSLLELVCGSPDLAVKAAERVPPEWLEHPVSRAAWVAVRQQPDRGVAAWIGSADGAARRLLATVSGRADLPEPSQRALEDHLRRLEARRLAAEREELRHRLASAAPQENQEKTLGRLQAIAARLQALARGDEIVVKGETE